MTEADAAMALYPLRDVLTGNVSIRYPELWGEWDWIDDRPVWNIIPISLAQAEEFLLGPGYSLLHSVRV